MRYCPDGDAYRAANGHGFAAARSQEQHRRALAKAGR
jgi:hypothetical protein